MVPEAEARYTCLVFRYTGKQDKGAELIKAWYAADTVAVQANNLTHVCGGLALVVVKEACANK